MYQEDHRYYNNIANCSAKDVSSCSEGECHLSLTGPCMTTIHKLSNHFFLFNEVAGEPAAGS